MQTYNGHVNTIGEALRLIEAVRFGLLPLTKRRLNTNERHLVKPGSVFVFDASKSGVQRWTDGIRWSASRLNGHFLLYQQKDNGSGAPLTKRALSVVTSDNRKFSLINYYIDSQVDQLNSPSNDPLIMNIEIPSNYYFRKVTQIINSDPENAFLLTPLMEADYNVASVNNLSNHVEYSKEATYKITPNGSYPSSPSPNHDKVGHFHSGPDFERQTKSQSYPYLPPITFFDTPNQEHSIMLIRKNSEDRRQLRAIDSYFHSNSHSHSPRSF